jgi:Rrf2 family nitric oxide-sensitive transcriptional repressor
MKLTLQTDIALRILITLAQEPERVRSVDDIAAHFKLSKNHLMKTAQQLAKHGYIKAIRGRSGGIKLAQDSASIVIGNVVRNIEPDMKLAECFQSGPKGRQCALLPNCKLKGLLGQALVQFLDVLDNKTLADIA